MGGNGIHHITELNEKTKTILQSATKNNSEYVMAQKFLPEISDGDKRILLIGGKPVPYALSRIPKNSNSKGNLAQGATGKGVELNARDKWICEQVGSKLNDMGLIFVGIDIIGDYLTEINVTSPTGIQEINALDGIHIEQLIWDAIEKRYDDLKTRQP